MSAFGQAEAHTFPLLLMFGEGLPAAPDSTAALAAALPGLHDAAALMVATQVSASQLRPDAEASGSGWLYSQNIP